MESVIALFRERMGKITYDMYGPRNIMAASADCSSAVYTAMVLNGAYGVQAGNISTVTEKQFLLQNGFEQVYAGNGIFEARRGDVFIWAPNNGDRNLATFTDGDLRASAMSAGHTGIFIDGHNIIHCNYGHDGISVNSYDEILGYNQPYYDGGVAEFVFRKTSNGSTTPAPTPKPADQILNIGSKITFPNVYRAGQVRLYDGIWQIRCDALCPIDFEWAGNGIPVEPVTETDKHGNATGDQVMNDGSYFKIPGTFEVLRLNNYAGLMWIAKINLGGYEVWVDVNTVHEI